MARLGYLASLFCALVHFGYFLVACTLGDAPLALGAAGLTFFFGALFMHYRKAVYGS